MKNLLLILILFAVVAVGAIFLTLNLQGSQEFGGAPGGGRAFSATTSRFAISTTANTLVGTSTCLARIITTEEEEINLLFGDEAGQDPVDDALGHTQAASTTVVYDAALYGCGLWKVIGDPASNGTITEFKSFQ